MKTLEFAQETMDYKLFWLKFIKKIWVVLAAVVIGTIVVGVPYYLKGITFGEGPSYKVVSQYYLDYDEDGSGAVYEYFNYYTWDEIADTDEFLSFLRSHLAAGNDKSDEELKSATSASVESDTRYLYTTVVTKSPEEALLMARAMELSIMDFAQVQKELKDVKLVTSPKEAEITYPDVRWERAFILGAVLGLFVGITGLCIFIVCDESVDLPITIEKRYEIRALGCDSFPESKNNICYHLKGKKSLALICTGADKTEVVKSFFEECLEEKVLVRVYEEDVLSKDFDFEKLRCEEGVVLLIKAGAHNGKRIERIVQQLRRQDILPDGAWLLFEDKKLLKHYYR